MTLLGANWLCRGDARPSALCGCRWEGGKEGQSEIHYRLAWLCPCERAPKMDGESICDLSDAIVIVVVAGELARLACPRPAGPTSQLGQSSQLCGRDQPAGR